jgi:hypothetical protein
MGEISGKIRLDELGLRRPVGEFQLINFGWRNPVREEKVGRKIGLEKPG